MADGKANPRRRRASKDRTAKRKIAVPLPPSVRSHLKASIREALLACESLFDEAVKALETGAKTQPGRRRKKIRVE